jgi:hypothetical protein
MHNLYRLGALAVLSAMLSLGSVAQGKPSGNETYDLKRCTPRVVKKGRSCDRVRIRRGEKLAYSPVVSFEILESGEVVSATLKRSSGIHEIDSCALEWAKGTKYNKRIGCGVIESDAVVIVDF